jgi:hypothetical protein
MKLIAPHHKPALRSETPCWGWLPLAVAFALGAAAASCVSLANSQSGEQDPLVDFEFSLRGIQTPRQFNKTLDVFVRWRYKPLDNQCPFSPTDNNCIQYQLWTRSLILNITLRATEQLPLGAEWERVNLALCRQIWAQYSASLVALSTSLHVNGDGRSAAARGIMPYEPGQHGSTCTMGPESFSPIAFKNALPNLGPY